MSRLNPLVKAVASARIKFIKVASGLTYEQSQFRPTVDSWSITEIVEHMVWAEMGGINGIWKTLEAMRSNKPTWSGELINEGLSIEQIIARTWKEKEVVPETARPRWGGSVSYWINALAGCQPLLESLSEELNGYDPEKIIYPHIISGPLNVIQRMEFLRFHLDRHRSQITRIKLHPGYPAI